MESGNSPTGNKPTASPLTGRLTEAEREALRQRAAQAREAASAAIERYGLLAARSRERLNATEQRLVAMEATLETVRQSVQRYAQLMKALEIPPERVLSLMKETVREQLPHPEREVETAALAESVVTWCIQGYYFNTPAA